MAAGSVMTKSGLNQIINNSFVVTSTNSFQYFAIGTNNATPTTTNIGLSGTIAAWTTGGTGFKAYLSVTADTTNQKVTIRGFVSNAEATSAVIYEYCDLTNNTTKIPAGRFVWNDAVTKTTANQLTILTVYKRQT